MVKKEKRSTEKKVCVSGCLNENENGGKVGENPHAQGKQRKSYKTELETGLVMGHFMETEKRLAAEQEICVGVT